MYTEQLNSIFYYNDYRSSLTSHNQQLLYTLRKRAATSLKCVNQLKQSLTTLSFSLKIK